MTQQNNNKQDPLSFLEETNDWLEEYPINIGVAFDNMVGKGQDIAQDKVDVICEWLAWKVNLAIERKRQWLVKTLHEMYKNTVFGKVMQVGRAIEKFVKNPLEAIGDFANAIFGPVGIVFQWVITLAKELPRLARNLAYIAYSLPPDPPTPRINYNKFKLNIGSISMDMIEQDPSNLPSPESMFPEPERPFSANSFEKEFNNAELKEKYFYDIKMDFDKDEYSVQSAINAYVNENSENQ